MQDNENTNKLQHENQEKLALLLYDVINCKSYDDACDTAKRLLKEMDKEVEVRCDKVTLAKERLHSGYYNRKDVLSKVAEKLLIELDLF